MLKASPLSSFQRRTSQDSDNTAAYLDALARHEEFMANIAVNYIGGGPLVDTTMVSNGSRASLLDAPSYSGAVSSSFAVNAVHGSIPGAGIRAAQLAIILCSLTEAASLSDLILRSRAKRGVSKDEVGPSG